MDVRSASVAGILVDESLHFACRVETGVPRTCPNVSYSKTPFSRYIDKTHGKMVSRVVVCWENGEEVRKLISERVGSTNKLREGPPFVPAVPHSLQWANGF